VFVIDCVIIAIVMNIGATEPGCPVPLCVEDSCLRSLESLQNWEVVVYNLGLSGGSYNVL
jgi:hypothetical protein